VSSTRAASQGLTVIHHHHIDLGTVLRGAVCALYSNLVTRTTGAAVRSEIERVITDTAGRTVTVIDFSQVMLLDYSCADEIVAKLMLRYAAEPHERADAEGYFVFRGLGEHHLDAVEAVLERRGLAIVALFGDEPALVGEVTPEERHAWELLRAMGLGDARDLGEATGLDAERAQGVLDALAARRLVVRVDGRYAALGAALPDLPGAPGAAA
jgi:hypothetical protein